MLEALTRVVDELVEFDASLMCDAEIRESFLALRREIDRQEAVAARLLVGVARRGIPAGDGAASTPAWVQFETGQRFTDAKASLSAGRACEVLPVTAKAWAQGEISASAARTICRGVRAGHEAVYTDIEATLVGFAEVRDLASVDGLIRHYQTRADALDGTEPSDANGLYLSRVGNRWKSNGDFDELAGMIHDEALRAAMDPPADNDTRGPAKKRADASTRIYRFFLNHADLPVEGGERPHINITVGWETIRDGATAMLTARPDDTVLSPTDIHQLLCDAQVARIVLGPGSIPLDSGRATYTPSKALRRAVVARDRHCRFPGCHRKPRWCEVHHVNPFPDGETVLKNVALFCDYHHHRLHKPGWSATFDGHTLTITKPNGNPIQRT
jgi:Domain of unknown function (DUF222)